MNTNQRPAEEHLRAEPDPPAASQGLDAVSVQRRDERHSPSQQRGSARLNSPLEAQQPSSAASPDRQAPVESTRVRLHLPPGHASPTAGKDAAEVAASRQRLLALQRELALLKRAQLACSCSPGSASPGWKR